MIAAAEAASMTRAKLARFDKVNSILTKELLTIELCGQTRPAAQGRSLGLCMRGSSIVITVNAPHAF